MIKPAVILLLVFTVLVSAVSVVQTQHVSRKVFMEIEQLKKDRDLLNEEWGRLQLEQSTWALDERVERTVKEELGMYVPENGSLVFLVP
ncbi:MAG: cell division protein FtsL [Gammaproteobacteria bacterium]|nr:cell division protein FtsL [Gammaproteobacteria bacterium]